MIRWLPEHSIQKERGKIQNDFHLKSTIIIIVVVVVILIITNHTIIIITITTIIIMNHIGVIGYYIMETITITINMFNQKLLSVWMK